MAYFLGIDIGSTTGKGVITSNGNPLVYHQLPSRANYRTVAIKLRDELLAKAGLSPKARVRTVITGHRVNDLPFNHKSIADIRCCARGINHLFPEARTVIDVQAMSSRAIRLSPAGQVTNFVASEKCAAGSGRFLEIMANILRMDIGEIGRLSLKSKHPISFTTSCAVFEESEVISRVAEGTAKEDILAGVHQALAIKLSTLIDRVGFEERCAVSGGGLNEGLIRVLEAKLKSKLVVPERPRFVTALGAAIIAQEVDFEPKSRL